METNTLFYFSLIHCKAAFISLRRYYVRKSQYDLNWIFFLPFLVLQTPVLPSCHFFLSAESVCLLLSDFSLSNLQLYSRPNIGVGMLGWAACVSHNKASHKGVALRLTSSHLTARHGQVVCMETHLCVCVCVCVVQALPTLLSSGETERLLSPSALLLLFFFFFGQIYLPSLLLFAALTFTDHLFINSRPSSTLTHFEVTFLDIHHQDFC